MQAMHGVVTGHRMKQDMASPRVVGSPQEMWLLQAIRFFQAVWSPEAMASISRLMPYSRRLPSSRSRPIRAARGHRMAAGHSTAAGYLVDAGHKVPARPAFQAFSAVRRPGRLRGRSRLRCSPNRSMSGAARRDSGDGRHEAAQLRQGTLGLTSRPRRDLTGSRAPGSDESAPCRGGDLPVAHDSVAASRVLRTGVCQTVLLVEPSSPDLSSVAQCRPHSRL